MRNPKLVETDVRNNYVSMEQALDSYGVVLDKGSLSLDEKETEKTRKERLTERLKLGTSPTIKTIAPTNGGKHIMSWADVINLGENDKGERYWQCANCDHVLGSAEEDWKTLVTSYRAPLAKAQPAEFANDNDEFHLRELYCPNCAHMFEVLNIDNDRPDPVTFKLY